MSGEEIKEAFLKLYPIPEKPYCFSAGPTGFAGYANTFYFTTFDEAVAAREKYGKDNPDHGSSFVRFVDHDVFSNDHEGPHRGDALAFFAEGYRAGQANITKDKWGGG